MCNTPNNAQRPFRNFFPFSDDFLLFSLPILDDEEQRRSDAFEEERFSDEMNLYYYEKVK